MFHSILTCIRVTYKSAHNVRAYVVHGHKTHPPGATLCTLRLISALPANVHAIAWRNQVLTRDCDSDTWARDPESSVPLEIVKDDQGRIYVRAQVRHFSIWSFWKKDDLGEGDQTFKMDSISWRNRRRHRSLIKNDTPDDVTIYAYALRMSQWDVTLKSFGVGVGAQGMEANAQVDGNAHHQINAAALVPQMVPIHSGKSHWFEIPRVGAGVWSSRKAMVAIVTESNDDTDGQRLR